MVVLGALVRVGVCQFYLVVSVGFGYFALGLVVHVVVVADCGLPGGFLDYGCFGFGSVLCCGFCWLRVGCDGVCGFAAMEDFAACGG